jgi:hypothetical protein
MYRTIRQLAILVAAVSAAACDRNADTVAGPSNPTRAKHDIAPASAIARAGVFSGEDSCALRTDGTLACWGDNDHGQTSPPVATYTQIDAGPLTLCGTTVTGQGVCWGFNAQGQANVAGLPSGLTYTQVAIGFLAGCGVRSDNSIACWSGSTPGLQNVPLGLYTRVAVALSTVCAITTSGTLVCWGDDPYGEVSTAPSPPEGKKFVQLDVGNLHGCALVDDGNVLCWGDNRFGETTVPALPTGVGYTSVAVITTTFSPDIFGGHSCATRTDGQLVCWGDNRQGQLNVPTLPSGVTYTSVSAGTAYTCASRSDGRVTCWGWNGTGGLNVPSTLNLNKHAQSIVFASPLPTDGAAGATFTLEPDAASGEPLVVNSTTPAVCSVSGSVVSFDAAGTCTLTIDRAGNDDYETAPRVSTSINVVEGRLAQTIAFTSPVPSPAYVNDTYVVSANGGASQNPVMFSSLTTATCTVSNATVTFVAVGECKVAADQESNANYLKATQMTQSISVSKRPQTIAFNPAAPAEGTLGSRLSVGANGGGSGNAVALSIVTPNTCSLSGNKVTLTAIGDCTIAANQSGNTAYDAAPQATETIAVRWLFSGFSGLSASPSVNRAAAGSSMELTFSLGGSRGLAIIAADSPTVAFYSCGSTIPDAGSGTSVQAPGKSLPLVYDTRSGQYTFTWKTEKTWAGSCAELSVRLVDGSVRTALFQFK